MRDDKNLEELLAAIKDLLLKHPDWRLGQAVSNVAVWAKGLDKGAIWDMSDREFIDESNRHLSGD